MHHLNTQRVNHNLRSGLAFTGQQSYQISRNAHIERDRTAGKMVLTNFCESPELFEIVRFSTEGETGLVITLRSLRNKQCIQIDSFKKVRHAHSNEVMARSRKGSESYEHYWQNRNANYQY